MLDSYYCRKSLYCSKTLEKKLNKVHFRVVPIMAVKSMKDPRDFYKRPLQGKDLQYPILTSLNTVDHINVCDGPRMHKA